MTNNSIPSPRLEELRRRRLAAQRLERLECCDQGHHDPLLCGTNRLLDTLDKQCRPKLTGGHKELDLDVIAKSARILLERTGHPGIYPLHLVRELWKRGGKDRELAEKIHAAGGARP